MAASQFPISFGRDIEADAKLLWPSWADLLRLSRDSCTSEEEWYETILCGSKGYSPAGEAGEMLHKDIKNMILRRPVEEITAG